MTFAPVAPEFGSNAKIIGEFERKQCPTSSTVHQSVEASRFTTTFNLDLKVRTLVQVICARISQSF
jgi:hypothetical protein